MLLLSFYIALFRGAIQTSHFFRPVRILKLINPTQSLLEHSFLFINYYSPFPKKKMVFSHSQKACFREQNGFKPKIFPDSTEEVLQPTKTLQLSLNWLFSIYPSSSKISKSHVCILDLVV